MNQAGDIARVSAEAIVKALGGCRGMAKCPAHRDTNPSLSITERDGKVLVHCFSGCEQAAVVNALKALGLWPERERATPSAAPVIVSTYDYRNEAGELLYQVVRYVPKDFRQRRPDGHGGWIPNLHGVRRVLYHLPEVIEAPIVFVVEGERDVETLRSQGFVATTNAGGAKAPWLPEYTETLAGHECILIPDNDRPGWDRVKLIARALLGHAARIRVLDLPRETKDISDWFGAGHSECELIAMLEGVNVA